MGRILLVDDDPKDVELTLTALDEYHLANEVVVAADGEQALDYLYCRGGYRATRPNENPAVVLLDLKLPKVDGLEVLKQIKSDRAAETDPVVVLTSSREEKDMVASYQLGVNAYVVKPVDSTSSSMRSRSSARSGRYQRATAGKRQKTLRPR